MMEVGDDLTSNKTPEVNVAKKDIYGEATKERDPASPVNIKKSSTWKFIIFWHFL